MQTPIPMSTHLNNLLFLFTCSLAAISVHAAPPSPAPTPLPLAAGSYQPSWESLSNYQCPEWFQDAKFGIWAHWGPQCQPEQGDWYARKMYMESAAPNSTYQTHIREYGHPSKSGFKDIDNLWHAQNWNPDQLIALYKAAGAKYFVALANHHDNFDCYDSAYQPWNSVKIGPHKDMVGGWAKAARAAGLRFGVTVHAARTWDWFDVAHGADKTGPLAGVPYDGNMTVADGKGLWWDGLDPADLYGPAGAARTPEAHAAYDVKFYNRTIDLIHKYNPDLLYFDDGFLPLRNEPGDYGLKIAADYYNTNVKLHGDNEAVMNTKGIGAKERKALVLDIERGKREQADPLPWQTDTCIGHWHYDRSVFNNHSYKKISDVVPLLADIVSKNGNLLLNIPVRGDGTIDEDETAFLKEMAAWMAVNGEGIYATRPWAVTGEGPSTLPTASEKNKYGGQKDTTTTPFTAEDIRFTTTKDGKTLYAIVLGWPTDGKVTVKSLAKGSANYPGEVGSVQLLGDSQPVSFNRDADGLVVTLPAKKPCDVAYVLKIKPGA